MRHKNLSWRVLLLYSYDENGLCRQESRIRSGNDRDSPERRDDD
jgi:hypothetical protein